MSTFTRILFFFIIAGSILGCSRKNNTFLSRNWHAVTTEYNTLYNGNLALDQGREELNENYEDNYWDILPVERMHIDEEITLPDSIKNQNFGFAEEKAVKAIQRHSMLIEGKERNPQIDEAYLLLGKARYFDQRFIPALEAFNYILHKYPASNNINHAQVWREKTNLRLDNNRLAIKNLKTIIDRENLDDQVLADANATLAQAFINLQEIDSALVPLEHAAEFTSKNEEKGRYYFILGQLYNTLEQPQYANEAFDEVINLNRRSPRIYMINAYVQKARNLQSEGEKDQSLRELLAELEEDRENRPFLDKIYFQIGEYYSNIDSMERAVAYYNKSLASASSDKFLRSINYEILANISFDNARFSEAAKYFDSTLANLSPKVREYRDIKKKRENLGDVIRYQEIAKETDSILWLSNLSREEQITHFTSYTDSLELAIIEETRSGNIEIGNSSDSGVTASVENGIGSAVGDFYFYNPSRVTRGAREFVNRWGNRQLADNWRWGENGTNRRAIEEQEDVIADFNPDADPRFDPRTYVSQIPDSKLVLDSLQKERNHAYYQLGLIYNEKFEEYEMAAEKLEILLDSSPEERLILPAKYNLYKIYGHLGRHGKQEDLEEDILKNHANSRYAAFIRNPESLTEDRNTPEASYQEVYEKFENQEYEEVLEESNRYISEFSGDDIVPKFELLKAMATGRLLGVEAYKTALNYVAESYPQTREGKRAQDIHNRSIPELADLEYNMSDEQTNFKLVFSFETSEKERAAKVKEEIEKAIAELQYRHLSTSLDVYNPEEVFVVVHGFEDERKALGFSELLSKKNYNINEANFAISSENYRIAQILKNLDTYLNP